MDEPIAERPARKEEHRRGRRFPVVVPVEATWQDAAGKNLREAAQANEVNAQGGLLDMQASPDVGSRLALTNLVSGEAIEARVVAIRRSQEGGIRGVAVELLVPNETFWGVNFRLRKTSDDLLKIENVIKSGGVEPRILRDFRDAVDYVRKTAWAVQEWQERQLQKHDPQTVLPLLTAERIRRATQLCKAITADFAAHDVTRETAGIDEFYRTVESLYRRVANLFKGREA